MQTPNWEDIVNAAENVGISRLSIIAYGYYGSRATGLATPESDEDIFVVIDTTVQKEEKMHITDACDIKFISAKLAPFPPSRFLISAFPSAFPLPKV